MQYAWRIKLFMSNGEIICGLYKCGYKNSSEVGKELLSGNDYTFNSMSNEDGTCQIFFRLKDVSVIEIGPPQ